MITVLLGLLKGDRFSYARALYDPSKPLSIVVRRVAEELGSLEVLDKDYAIEVPDLGRFRVVGVCSIEKALLEGQLIEVPAVMHVVDSDRIGRFDALMGRDLELAWGLYIDRLSGSLRSIYSRPIEKRY